MELPELSTWRSRLEFWIASTYDRTLPRSIFGVFQQNRPEADTRLSNQAWPPISIFLRAAQPILAPLAHKHLIRIAYGAARTEGV